MHYLLTVTICVFISQWHSFPVITSIQKENKKPSYTFAQHTYICLVYWYGCQCTEVWWCKFRYHFGHHFGNHFGDHLRILVRSGTSEITTDMNSEMIVEVISEVISEIAPPRFRTNVLQIESSEGAFIIYVTEGGRKILLVEEKITSTVSIIHAEAFIVVLMPFPILFGF